MCFFFFFFFFLFLNSQIANLQNDHSDLLVVFLKTDIYKCVRMVLLFAENCKASCLLP